MNARVSPIPHAARPYQGRRAGLVSRTLAGAVDLVVIVSAFWLGYAAVSAVLFVVDPRGFDFPDVSLGGWLAAEYVLAVGYLTLGWSTSGRTVGSLVMGLRVLSHNGSPMRPVGALLRALFCVTFPIGVLWIVVSAENRSLQDLVLRTSVVYDWHRRIPPAPEPTAPSRGPT
ncbi:MAG TPA: RDD family protein [Jiangellaceae bacterium]|nr:RDD family protein [Jiangellaceae bacterium]